MPRGTPPAVAGREREDGGPSCTDGSGTGGRCTTRRGGAPAGAALTRASAARRIIALLRRARAALLLAAALDLVVLMGALIHDFQLVDLSGGWLTSAAALAGARLTVGHLVATGGQE